MLVPFLDPLGRSRTSSIKLNVILIRFISYHILTRSGEKNVDLLLESEDTTLKWFNLFWHLGLLGVLMIGLYHHAHLGLSMALILLLLKWLTIMLSNVFHHDR